MNDVRIPPNDANNEESLLGALLIDGDKINLVENTVKPSDFYYESNQKVFECCLNLRSRHEAINYATLSQELERKGYLVNIGGIGRLDYLVSVCPTSLDIEDYANIVYRLSVSRQLIMLGDKISIIGYNTEPNVNDTMNDIISMVSNFRKTVTVYDELVSPKNAADIIYDMVMNEYRQPEHVMSWGFRDIDKITSGIYPELIIIGARPSVGKTQWMLDILENLAWHDKKILFCSAEMSIRSLMERKIARELKVDIKLIRHSGLDDSFKDRLLELSAEIADRQVYYLPQGASSQDIYNEASKLKDTIGLDIVFVDYLQILKDCWQSGKESKTVLVGRASKILKSLVSDLQIPVICASQLNRDIERRTEENRKPVLADLRESGDIEQDADVVFLLWRDMENVDEEVRNILEVKMAKNRQLGDAQAEKLVWIADGHRYADIAV